MPGSTPIRGWPFGQLTDNVTDLISVGDLAVAVENDLFGTLGPLTAHCCLVYRSGGDGDFAIGDSSATAVGFPSELVDTDGYHDSVTNISRIVVPTGLAGYYMFGGNVHWGSVAGGTRREIYVDINASGSRVAASQQVAPAGTFPTGAGPTNSCVGFSHLAAGDYLRLSAYQDSGGVVNALQQGQMPNFWAVRLPVG